MASTTRIKDVESASSFMRTTIEGEKITYRMKVLQQPEAARANGSESARFTPQRTTSAGRIPIDPPPVVQLLVFHGANAENDITFSYNADFFLFASLKRADLADRLPSGITSVPVLTGMPVSGMAYLNRPEEAGYFIFPDLHVRHEGCYRLNFTLYENLKGEQFADSEMLQDSGTQNASTFLYRLQVKSQAFTVSSAKTFPNRAESIPSTRILGEQGIRVNRQNRKPGQHYEGEDDSVSNRSSVAVPDVDNWPLIDTNRAVSKMENKERIRENVHQSPQVDPQSDTKSDVSSEAESLFSIAVTSISSMTSVDDEISSLAVSELVDLLLADGELESLYLEAIKSHKVGPDRFERNLYRLLNQYSVDLGREAENGHQKAVVYLIRSRSKFIANRIRMKLAPSGDNKKFERLRALSGSKLSILESYLRGSDQIAGVETSQLVEDDSASNSSDEDWDDVATENQQFERLPRLTMVKEFMVSSRAFADFRKNLRQFVHKDLDSKVQRLIRKWSKVQPDNSISQASHTSLQRLVSELEYTEPNDISILHKNNQGLSNWLKSAIEDLTGQSWDWWPLSNRRVRLSADEACLCWQCSCGEERSENLPAFFAGRLAQILRQVSSTPRIHIPNHPPTSTRPYRQSTATVQTRTSSTASSSQDNNQSAYAPRGSNRLANPRNPVPFSIPASLMIQDPTASYVLFGVPTGNDIRLAQIKILNHTDDLFFRELRERYMDLVGILRRFLSIWKYSHCDFVKFEKIGEGEIVPRGASIPLPTDTNYQYKPKPVEHMPPITTHEFRRRFYACYGRCSISKIWLLRRFHKCKIPCRHSQEALSRIPKKVWRLEEGGNLREFFWGICAVEHISFIMVATYHVFILFPPFIFWFLWLFVWGHSGDLQNASVPFLSALGLISLFWFPLISR